MLAKSTAIINFIRRPCFTRFQPTMRPFVMAQHQLRSLSLFQKRTQRNQSRSERENRLNQAMASLHAMEVSAESFFLKDADELLAVLDTLKWHISSARESSFNFEQSETTAQSEVRTTLILQIAKYVAALRRSER